MTYHTLSILISLLVLSSSLQIKNINHDLMIDSLEQYEQYIRTLNGLATEGELKGNPVLAQIVEKERPSILAPQAEVVLALVDQIALNNQNLADLNGLKQLQQLDTLLAAFELIDLVDLDPQTLTQKIDQLQKAGKIVHTLETSPELAQLLSSRKLQESDSDSDSEESSVPVKAEHEEKAKNQHAVKTVKEGKSNPTYILKFFFGFLFIIVSLGALMSIANMQNKKDTLLYAKFIADVGAR